MAESGPGHRWWERGGIRLRTTIVAMLAVGLGLGVAGAALVMFVRSSLRESLQDEARLRTVAIARELGTSATFTPGDPEEEFVQILTGDGSVIEASPNVEGLPAVVAAGPGDAVILDRAPIPDGPVLVLARTATMRGEPVTLIVGRSLETVAEATVAVAGALAVAVPALLLLVGALTWILVGRVLAPVEVIRREVDEISTRELDRRVPDPTGHDEIARLAATMNAMLARLEAGHLRERRLVSDASHELRSPISSMRQHAEVARDHPDVTSISELAAIVLEQGDRLQRIVDDLLLLSSLDEGALRLRSEPVDLDDLVFEAATRLRASAPLRVCAAARRHGGGVRRPRDGRPGEARSPGTEPDRERGAPRARGGRLGAARARRARRVDRRGRRSRDRGGRPRPRLPAVRAPG